MRGMGGNIGELGGRRPQVRGKSNSGRRRLGNGQNRWEVVMARGGRVRTPGATCRGSGVPGPLTVIPGPASEARAGAVSGAGVGGIRLRNPASAAPPLSCVRGGGRKGRGQGESAPDEGRGSGLRRRLAVGAPSTFPRRPAGGARRRIRRAAGCDRGTGLPLGRGRSARGRRSSGPRAAGCRGPALGAGLGPCGRGDRVKVMAPAAHSLLPSVAYRAP